MRSTLPHSIEISAVPQYLQEQSTPEEGRYAFAYHITIRNLGAEPAQLLSRHWIITDGGGKVEEVRGDGVVGEQPVIAAGGEYRYTSGSLLSAPVGSMRGSYAFRLRGGEEFEAPIPVFTLSVPGALN